MPTKDLPTAVAAFIDGAYLRSTARALGFEVDFAKLLVELGAIDGGLLRAHYYAVLPDDPSLPGPWGVVDWLSYNGYAVTRKTVRPYTDAAGRPRYNGDVNVDIAVDALGIADRTARALIFTGSRDLCPVVAALQRMGVRVGIVSTLRVNPAPIADELRRLADDFVELEAFRPRISRDRAADRDDDGPD